MDSLIRFYGYAAKLKTLKRAGWRRCGIEQECESVADHSFGVALLAMLVPPKNPGTGIDREHCVLLALVHDLAEAIVGDITPHDAVNPAEKHRREQAAMEELSKILGDDELIDLWREFEQGQTPEAQLVRDLDVIEMAWQASAYEHSGKLTSESAAQFIRSAQQRVQSAWGRRMLQSVLDSA